MDGRSGGRHHRWRWRSGVYDRRGNDPLEPQLPDSGIITYDIVVQMDNETVNGTETIDFSDNDMRGNCTWDEENFTSFTWYTWNWHGYSLDQFMLETSLGPKAVVRSVRIGDTGSYVYVTYSGSGSRLTYRQDIITRSYLATVTLMNADFPEINVMDLNISEDFEPFNGYPLVGPINDWYYWMFDNSWNTEMIAPGYDHTYLSTVNVTNTAFYYFSSENIWQMVNGSAFQYDHERSVIGNGTAQFVEYGGWHFRVIMPVGDGPHLFRMSIHVEG